MEFFLLSREVLEAGPPTAATFRRGYLEALNLNLLPFPYLLSAIVCMSRPGAWRSFTLRSIGPCCFRDGWTRRLQQASGQTWPGL